MKVRWNNFNSIGSWLESRFRIGAAKAKLSVRLDGFALILVATIVLLVGILCFGAIKILERQGAFDDALVQQVRDERKLNNFWDGRRDSKVYDGVFHHHDGKIYISSENGEINYYDPRTKLWGGGAIFFL